MRQKSIINYFLNGFSLTNQSLELFLISLSLFLPSLLRNFIPNLEKVLSPLSFILLFINIGFMLSLPVFLEQKQQKKASDYRNIVKITFKNTKRIILPGVLLFFIFVILLILSFILLAVFLHPSRDEVTTFFQNIGKGWQPIFLVPIVLMYFFEFTSFFFSLEHNGLLDSMKKSIVTAFSNLGYISIIIIIGVTSYSTTSFIPIQTFWGQVIRIVLGGYIALWLTASSLFYYQGVIKRPL